MGAFLTQISPWSAVVSSVPDWEQALETSSILEPDVMVLHSNSAVEEERTFCKSIRTHRRAAEITVIGVRDAWHDAVRVCPSEHCPYCPADYCVARDAAFDAGTAAVLRSLLPRDSPECPHLPNISL